MFRVLSIKSVTVIFLLWGIFFLEYQVPLALGLILSALLISWLLVTQARADVVVWLVLINIGYWILSGLLFGGLAISDFAKPNFYSGDGRILVSLVPLVLFTIWTMETKDLDRIAHITLGVSLGTLVIYVVWALTQTRIFSGEGHPDEFHGLLTSHTGAGTFFGSLFVFTALYGYAKRNRWILSVGILLAAPVVATGSREALVGILGVIAWLLAIKLRNFRLLAASVSLLVVSILLLPVISEKTYNRVADIVSVDFAKTVLDQANAAAGKDWQTGDWIPGEDVENLEEGDVTSLVRVLLWTYAAKKFIDSPVLGMGWGRFNDRDVAIVDVGVIGSFAMDGRKIFSTSNAHNSYFHIAAESGFVGLLLFFGMWVYIYFRVDDLTTAFHVFPQVAAFGLAVQGLIVFAAGCALTGHAFGAPSSMIILTLICGVALSFRRNSVHRLPADIAAGGAAG